jgi:hypothetical protein
MEFLSLKNNDLLDFLSFRIRPRYLPAPRPDSPAFEALLAVWGPAEVLV